MHTPHADTHTPVCDSPHTHKRGCTRGTFYVAVSSRFHCGGFAPPRLPPPPSMDSPSFVHSTAFKTGGMHLVGGTSPLACSAGPAATSPRDAASLHSPRVSGISACAATMFNKVDAVCAGQRGVKLSPTSAGSRMLPAIVTCPRQGGSGDGTRSLYVTECSPLSSRQYVDPPTKAALSARGERPTPPQAGMDTEAKSPSPPAATTVEFWSPKAGKRKIVTGQPFPVSPKECGACESCGRRC